MLIERCWRCGKTLSDPLSVYLSFGPVCRKTCGVMHDGGPVKLLELSWKLSDGAFVEIVASIWRSIQWWRDFTVLGCPEINGTELFANAERLLNDLIAGPGDGVTVVRKVYGLIAEVRFRLEPTLGVLKRAKTVRAAYVQGVPELQPIDDGIAALMSGMGAVADAVDFADVRKADAATIRRGRTVTPEGGEEQWPAADTV